MNPATVWLIAQIIAITTKRLQESGKYDTLTQAEAQAEAQRVTEALSTHLPTPQDLIQQGEDQAPPSEPQ